MTNFSVRPLTIEDLPSLSWTGPKRHQEYLKEWFDRSATGELVLLGLFDGDEIVGFSYVDFALVNGAGTLAALTIKEELRSQGLGTILINAAEELVREKGLSTIELRVETKNERALALYEKLGYSTRDASVESWEQYDTQGNIEMYTTDAFIMRKDLP